MDEEFDTVIHPHPPLPLPLMLYENRFEVDPIRIDPIINTVVRLDPITVHIARIGLLGAETPVDEDVVNTSQPKCFDGARSNPRRGPAANFGAPQCACNA